MAEYGYVKLADTEHGEIGHNGRTFVVDHPFAADDAEHPAYYEETGALFLDHNGLNPRVEFRAIRNPSGASRGGRRRATGFAVALTGVQAAAAETNRAAYDAAHRPEGGYRYIVD